MKGKASSWVPNYSGPPICLCLPFDSEEPMFQADHIMEMKNRSHKEWNTFSDKLITEVRKKKPKLYCLDGLTR